jgi:Bifunctional DNA primase/polymerase, N-terminal
VSGLQPTNAAEIAAALEGGREGRQWRCRCPILGGHGLLVRDGDAGTCASLVEALVLIEQGLPCFPCRADKRPATPRGFKDGTCDRNIVRELWRRYPGPLIGIPTGEISRLAVLDIDPRHGGNCWLAGHRNRIPATRVHRTRSGGLHLIFQHTAGLRSSAGKISAGVDVRATGGYIIWWPAAGLSAPSEIPVAPWPEWLRRPRDRRSRALQCQTASR